MTNIRERLADAAQNSTAKLSSGDTYQASVCRKDAVAIVDAILTELSTNLPEEVVEAGARSLARMVGCSEVLEVDRARARLCLISALTAVGGGR